MMTQSLPPERQLIYFLIACFLPLLFVLVYFIPEQNELDRVTSRIVGVEKMDETKKSRQALNMAVRAKFQNSDRYYIDKNLENLTFLANEKESLVRLLSNPDFPQDEALKKRLESLSGPSNQLAFSEGALQQFAFFRETVETLMHPVEIDREDLENILSKIEGTSFTPDQKIPPGRPQLIILDFKVVRKPNLSGTDVFSLDLKILKREFT